MSRLGKRIIPIPAGVEFKIDPQSKDCQIAGPLGILQKKLTGYIKVKVEGQTIKTEMPDASPKSKMMVGTVNALIQNWIEGVTKGYQKKLVLKGLGYKAQKVQPQLLKLNLDYSHPVNYVIPAQIGLEVIKNTEIIINGIDKELVGLVASQIKKLKKVEPYKGKGILYKDEKIKHKVGKSTVGKK